MSCIAYRRAMTGVLNRVMVVVLLGCVGLTAGVVFALHVHRYERTVGLELPRHSPHSASELVTVTQGRHPGVRVFAGGERSIYFSASSDAQEALSLAYREVVAANNGMGTPMLPFLARPLPTPTTRYGLFGLLAGLSVALGFLIPPRSRVTAAPHSSGRT